MSRPDRQLPDQRGILERRGLKQHVRRGHAEVHRQFVATDVQTVECAGKTAQSSGNVVRSRLTGRAPRRSGEHEEVIDRRGRRDGCGAVDVRRPLSRAVGR